VTTSRRSLTDDLLDDLRQGAPRPVAPAATPRPSAPPVAAADDTATVELRITPRAWVPLAWDGHPARGGLRVSLGPVRLSVGLPRG
jgi:hypothetical protein